MLSFGVILFIHDALESILGIIVAFLSHCFGKDIAISLTTLPDHKSQLVVIVYDVRLVRLHLHACAQTHLCDICSNNVLH